MRGDFSRDTFDPLRHFSRVLVQQGRLQLDADSNEQSDILLHYLRTLASDLMGGHAGPDKGFLVEKPAAGMDPLNFTIAGGRYYVGGVLAENETDKLEYIKQPWYNKDDDALVNNKPNLVYLDVWERHVTALDDDSIRDVALGQADTTTRAQIAWQVRRLTQKPDLTALPAWNSNDWDNSPMSENLRGMSGWFGTWPPTTRGALKAKGRSADSGDPQPCIISPESQFRGLENQLYRVEIHRGGQSFGNGVSREHAATFTWSRNNGSDVVALKSLGGGLATLVSMGRGDRESFEAGDWVEIVEDGAALKGLAGPLAKVSSVDSDDMTVTLVPMDGGPALPSFTAAECVARHVQLRRWDYRVNSSGSTPGDRPKQADDGALLVEEDKWLALEDGVQVMFTSATGGAPRYEYRSADCWLIPARTATGDVEWPGPVGNPEARPPRGVRHFYAPLAVLDVQAGSVANIKQLRRTLKPVLL